jgi:hypothetical protein
MICTERYVEKVDGALGGVGYEKMIVTAEIIRDLGTAKFIPVIRQTTPERKIPRFIGGRYYIDLSADANADAERQHLLKELHNVPPDRPPLGQSPFTSRVRSQPARRRLDDHAVTGGKRRSKLPGRHHDWKVPGNDLADHP